MIIVSGWSTAWCGCSG